MDVIGSFVASCCREVEQGEAEASLLYGEYVRWAQENNEYKMSMTKFGKEIKERFRAKKNSAGSIVYKGLILIQRPVQFRNDYADYV